MQIYFEKLDYCDNSLVNNLIGWYNMLDAQKKKRIDSIKDEKRRHLLILSDHLARIAISEFTGKLPEEIIFRHNSHGKPILPEGQAHFNVSHSGEYVVCCISKKPCGIDIEVLREVNLKSAKKFCTDNELNYIKEAKNKAQAYLYIWTRKEAYFKSIGCGISTVLSAVDVLKTNGFITKVTHDYVMSTYEKINGG